MKALDSIHILDENQLAPDAYAVSLIQAACEAGIFTDDDLLQIRQQLLELLAERTEAWNHGESSSVRMEQAQEFLASILFTLGLQLKAEPSADRAAETLKTEDVRVCFEKGLERVKRKLAISRLLQNRILKKLFPSQNIFFRDTLQDGIDGFFRLYDPQFAAHEIHITADYPLCAGRPQLLGVEFIEQYLSCAEAENLFLCQFDPDRIHRLLLGLTPGYAQIPMNLFEPIFLTALGILLAGGKADTLELTDRNRKTLYRIFSGRSREETESILQDGLTGLDAACGLPRLAREYGALCMPQLAQSVTNGISYHCLDKVFLKMP